MVLSEFRALRTEIQGWRQDLGDRVIAVETVIKPAILGNGQPSRLSAVEARCTDLERAGWRLSGVAAATGALFAAALEVALHFLPRSN